ncbi:ABC transporter ATP-binding protein [Microbacterium sp. 18062]|uniref:ABC transporter ATP-binding protein n=1 Tax=Microbacterium sp. 18062 TaxID=2681410 RepID=UPI00135842A9|nr:ABC transporter ATP-binding protein [Microbacterium sp. 18062]
MTSSDDRIAGLGVSGLSIDRRSDGGRLVDGVDLAVGPGECLGLVGESGSGKSLTLRAIAGILPDTVARTGGAVTVDDAVLDPRRASPARIGTVFQDPAAAMNPLMRIGSQVAAVRRHVRGRSRHDAREDALRLLERAALPHAARLYDRYPHELSGGQRQRVMIAFALASDPRFLLCDEPTTALDVTVQAEILTLLDDIRVSERIGILFVSHDLPVVARISSRLAVMKAGRIVEQGPTADVIARPADPYTRGLVAAARAVAMGFSTEDHG